jgi:hypothetical protein
MKVNDRELATVLAALRHWQRLLANLSAVNELPHFDTWTPLNDDEVDELCERLNIEQAQTKPLAPLNLTAARSNTWAQRGLQAVADIMSGKEWNADTLDAVAKVVRDAGYTIKEPE